MSSFRSATEILGVDNNTDIIYGKDENGRILSENNRITSYMSQTAYDKIKIKSTFEEATIVSRTELETREDLVFTSYQDDYQGIKCFRRGFRTCRILVRAVRWRTQSG